MAGNIPIQLFHEWFTAYNVVLELLVDRKCDQEFLEKYYNIPLLQFRELLTKGELEIRAEASIYNTIYYVKFIENRLKKYEFTQLNNEVRDLINEEEDKIHRIIIITDDSLPHQTKSLINNINKARKILPNENQEDYENAMGNVDEKDKVLQYEHFKLERLGYNPTKHILVPKHILLSEEETKEVLETFNAKKSHFPAIKIDDGVSGNEPDPIAKWLGLKAGDMVKIEGKSSVAGKSIKYRVGRS